MIAVGGKTDRTIRCRPADAGFVCQVGDGERIIYALGVAIEQPCHRGPQRRLALCAERAHAPPSNRGAISRHCVHCRCGGFALQRQQCLIAPNDTKLLAAPSTVGNMISNDKPSPLPLEEQEWLLLGTRLSLPVMGLLLVW